MELTKTLVLQNPSEKPSLDPAFVQTPLHLDLR